MLRKTFIAWDVRAGQEARRRTALIHLALAETELEREPYSVAVSIALATRRRASDVELGAAGGLVALPEVRLRRQRARHASSRTRSLLRFVDMERPFLV